MENHLFLAIFAGLVGMIGWGLSDFFAKKTIDKVGDVVSLAWGHMFGVISLCVFIVHQYARYDYSPLETLSVDFSILILVMFGIGQAVIYLLLYRGFGKGPVGVLSPVFASFSGITALVSFLVFGEIIGGGALWALAAIFFGILLMNIDVKSFSMQRVSFNFTKVPGLAEVLVAMIMASFWTLFWDKFIGGKDWLAYSFLMYLFMTVAILTVCLIRKINIFVIPRNVYKFLFLVGLFEVAAYVGISIGYSKTGFTSVVALLSGAFSLPTIVLARIFLKERITMVQIVGAAVIISGIIFISLV